MVLIFVILVCIFPVMNDLEHLSFAYFVLFISLVNVQIFPTVHILKIWLLFSYC